MAREGKRNPELNRGIYACADLTTKRTKTKKESLEKQKKKTHRLYESDEFFMRDLNPAVRYQVFQFQDQ